MGRATQGREGIWYPWTASDLTQIGYSLAGQANYCQCFYVNLYVYFTDDGSLDFAGDRDTDWMAERATIPTADSAVNILRKHFIYHNNQPLKRSQPGKLGY